MFPQHHSVHLTLHSVVKIKYRHRHDSSCIYTIGRSPFVDIVCVGFLQSNSSWELPEVPWLTAHVPTFEVLVTWTGRPVYLRNRPLYGIDFSEEMHTTLTLWVVYQYIDKTLYIDIRSWLIQCEAPYAKCISGDMNDFVMAHQFR